MEGVQVIGNSQCSVAFREQYSLQVSLEHGQRRWRRDEIWHAVPHSRRGHGKARSPTVDSRHGGTTRAGVDAERRRRRVPRSATPEVVGEVRWRNAIESGKREQRACTQSAVPPSANAPLAEGTSRVTIKPARRSASTVVVVGVRVSRCASLTSRYCDCRVSPDDVPVQHSLQRVTPFVELSVWQRVLTIDVPWRKFQNPEFGTKLLVEVRSLAFEDIWVFLEHNRIDWMKSPCQKSARCVQPFR